jgi:predicted DNA-binding protein (MmcQ/YjbR family)
MTYDEFDTYCASLKGTSMVIQWGDARVWKVGTKVFAIGGWEKINEPAFTVKTSESDFYVLQDQPGFRPAPYMASRGMKWVQLYDPAQFADEELLALIRSSHALVAKGLTKKQRTELGIDSD